MCEYKDKESSQLLSHQRRSQVTYPYPIHACTTRVRYYLLPWHAAVAITTYPIYPPNKAWKSLQAPQ